MKVCKIWDAEYPWDVRAEKICRALTDAGHEVHLVARNRDGRPLVERLPECTVHRLRPWNWLGSAGNAASMFPAFFNPRWMHQIARVARDTGADVLLSRDLPLTPTAVLVGARLHLPVVFDMAENYPALMRAIFENKRQRGLDWIVRNGWITERIERWTLRRVNHVLAVVEESRDRLVELGVPLEKISVVGNTPPRARAVTTRSLDHGCQSGALHVVYLGLLEVPRGIGTLLDAVAQCRQHGFAIRASLLGAGRDQGFLEAHARSLGLGEAVRFFGYVPNARALELVAEADVGVIPHHADASWNSTIPNKLFDYMAAGLPVLASDARPVARILAETGAGETFHDRDAGDLAARLTRLGEPALRARYGAAGRAAVLARYHWESDVARLLDALNGVRRRRPTVPRTDADDNASARDGAHQPGLTS